MPYRILQATDTGKYKIQEYKKFSVWEWWKDVQQEESGYEDACYTTILFDTIEAARTYLKPNCVDSRPEWVVIESIA